MPILGRFERGVIVEAFHRSLPLFVSAMIVSILMSGLRVQ